MAAKEVPGDQSVDKLGELFEACVSARRCRGRCPRWWFGELGYSARQPLIYS